MEALFELLLRRQGRPVLGDENAILVHLQELHLLAAGFGAEDQTDRSLLALLALVPVEPLQVELHLEEAANALALGDGISILPYFAKLTTQEAADFLGMSRPTFVKILQSGAIPFGMAGRHRRVTLRDVVDYQERAQSERRAALAEVAMDSIEHYDKQPKGVPSLKRHSDNEG